MNGDDRKTAARTTSTPAPNDGASLQQQLLLGAMIAGLGVLLGVDFSTLLQLPDASAEDPTALVDQSKITVDQNKLLQSKLLQNKILTDINQVKLNQNKLDGTFDQSKIDGLYQNSKFNASVSQHKRPESCETITDRFDRASCEQREQMRESLRNKSSK